MANSQIALTYKAESTGASPAALLALLSAVPLDLTLPRAVGVIPSSDVTTDDATSATRTIVLKMGAAYSTTAGVNDSFGATRGPIRSAVVQGGVPADYPCPPILSFTDPTGSGANGFAVMGLGGVHILAPGTGYHPSTTTALLVGGNLAPGGTPAVVTPTFTSTALTGVTIVSPGSGYTTFPQVVLVDTNASPGAGAVAVMTLTPVAYVIEQQGQGYSAPTLVLTPGFVDGCPDSYDQSVFFKNWMTTLLQAGALTAVQATNPVIS